MSDFANHGSNHHFYYNLSDRTIWLKTPKPQKPDFEIVISTEKFDLISMAED